MKPHYRLEIHYRSGRIETTVAPNSTVADKMRRKYQALPTVVRVETVIVRGRR